MFSESKFPASTLISNIRYKQPRSQNNNSFYPFNGQLDYILVHYFAHSETTKLNVDEFFINLLMKPMTKDLPYCNADEWIKKLSVILWEILNNKWTEHKFEFESGIDKVVK